MGAEAVKAYAEAIAAIYHLAKEMTKDMINVLTDLNSSRSVVLTVANGTDLPITLVNTHHDSGNFAKNPPVTIEPRKPGVFGSVSKANSFATGTEGSMIFGNPNGLNFRISWNNPFIGSNESSAVTSGNDGLYRAISTTGAGDQKAEMSYTLLQYPHPIIGAIRGKYGQMGWESSRLGFPTAPEKPTSDGVGRFQEFAGGMVYWHPDAKIGVHVVWGSIGARWIQLGREGFGYPVTDEMQTKDGAGRFNHFRQIQKNGQTFDSSIFWHPSTGAHEIYGAIRHKWFELGLEQGVLGYPTGHEKNAIGPAILLPDGTVDNPRREQEFQKGRLVYDRRTGQVSQQ